ncbi:MAG: Fis family transcriptional regulator, partial [Verrucomicrobia bacterium]
MARPKPVLDPKEREFWLTISQAAFTNPFSDQRYALDLKIAGRFEGEAERVEALKKVVCEHADKLESQGWAHLRDFSGAEREVMRIGFLFEAFHRFYHEFDQLIADQSKAGDTSCRAPFASEVLALLARRGFAAEEGVRFFGIFYQLRR